MNRTSNRNQTNTQKSKTPNLNIIQEPNKHWSQIKYKKITSKASYKKKRNKKRWERGKDKERWFQDVLLSPSNKRKKIEDSSEGVFGRGEKVKKSIISWLTYSGQLSPPMKIIYRSLSKRGYRCWYLFASFFLRFEKPLKEIEVFVLVCSPFPLKEDNFLFFSLYSLCCWDFISPVLEGDEIYYSCFFLDFFGKERWRSFFPLFFFLFVSVDSLLRGRLTLHSA